MFVSVLIYARVVATNFAAIVGAAAVIAVIVVLLTKCLLPLPRLSLQLLLWPSLALLPSA